jgi:hypothetical protein
LLDVVPQTARAELAEVSQIFAKLGGLDARHLGQGLAGNRAQAIGLEALQAAQVRRQSVNCLPGDVRTEDLVQAGGK